MPKELGTNLMASLKKVGKTGKTAIQIETEDLFFDPDDKLLAKALAAAMVSQLRENLLQGLGPAFEPLPAIKQSTAKARAFEAKQAGRGGNAADRYVDNEFRHSVRNNFERDYTAPKLGKFTPTTGGPRGVVSGMLAHSFAARPNKDGHGVTIFVAAKRGQPRPASEGRKAETRSALENVYGNVPLWSPAASESPKVKKAMFAAAKCIFGKNIVGLRKAALQLVKEMAGTATSLNELSDEAE